MVLFNNRATGDATVDVPLNSLNFLQIAGWGAGRTLTVNKPLQVTGSTGNFVLWDNVTIAFANGVGLSLLDSGYSYWGFGTITGGVGVGSGVTVAGTTLAIMKTPGELGVNLNVTQSLATRNPGNVTLFDMTKNLTLSGANNTIEADNGGTLTFAQKITRPGQVGLVGGIDFTVAHTAPLAV